MTQPPTSIADGMSSSVSAEGDYSYFSLGKEWDEIKKAQHLDDAQMWDKYNKPFLDDAAHSHKVFQFSHNPENDPGALGQEFHYLETLKNSDGKSMYRWDSDNMTMVPR